MQVGVRRATATDVARRAGISRMTLYRRFRDVEALLVALLTREVERLLGELVAGTAGTGTARQQLVVVAVEGVDRLAADPLFARLVEVDPEVLLPYLLERSGSSHRLVREHLADLLAAGREDGSIRPLDGEAASWVLLLVLQAFVYGARVLAKEAEPELVHAELRLLLDRYLAP